uniref:Uncharacterized protein n=1 Tax=Favella ehrenbergii TaxID=182087 RepID=A0A7S3HZI1_9SPIT|mmetsp:Transcript_23386/g.29027  ORF Transcript_23386/g.29027 Transcript_23386/m.29027 type:complete len:229 (+) Transcript_23386:3-689(+)
MRAGRSSVAFGQYFNWQGIRMFWSTLLVKRANFVPHVRAHSPAYVNYRKLHGLGIRHIVFDKDNTLTQPYTRDYFNKEIEHALLKECKEVFGEANVAILSNSAGSRDDPDHAEAKVIEQSLKLPVIRHELKKPAVHDDIMHHFNAREEHFVAIVGDRILSDVILGNHLGMFTIYVDPLHVANENFVVKFVRAFENKALGWVCPRDPPKHPLISDEHLHELTRRRPEQK